MIAYVFITISLILYPILGWQIIKRTRFSNTLQKRIIWITCSASAIIILAHLFHIKTTSVYLNWFLITSIYLTLSTLLWVTQFQNHLTLKRLSKVISVLIFFTGYFLAIFGFFFLMVFSIEKSVQFESVISHKLIFQERNIGSGPDPSIRLKEIEVYKKIWFLSFVVIRIAHKEYDNWEGEIGTHLDARIDQKAERIILNNTKEFEAQIDSKYHWTDTLKLKEKI